MLDVLKFVQGAVSRKDFVPELTHFRIRDGRITGYNGKLSVSSPISLDIDCCPKAVPFVRAIEACVDTAQLHMTPNGKLAIRSGKFRTHVDTIGEAFMGVEPEGTYVPSGGELLPALRLLYEFTAEDASRPWAAGVLLDGHSAFATNNIVLVEYWLGGYHFPFRINLPRHALKEIIRVGEEPTGLMVNAHNAAFMYEGGRWLRTQLNAIEWPDLSAHFDCMPPTTTDIAPGLFDALDVLKPFVDDLARVFVLQDRVTTTRDDAVEGTTVDVPGQREAGPFNLNMLSLLRGVATHIGFEEYPRPCPFYGNRLRGLITGMKS